MAELPISQRSDAELIRRLDTIRNVRQFHEENPHRSAWQVQGEINQLNGEADAIRREIQNRGLTV